MDTSKVKSEQLMMICEFPLAPSQRDREADLIGRMYGLVRAEHDGSRPYRMTVPPGTAFVSSKQAPSVKGPI